MSLDLTRITRVPYSVDLTAVFDGSSPGDFTGASVGLLAPRSDPDGTTNWTAVDFATGTASTTLAGPDADPTGAVVIPATCDLWVLPQTNNPNWSQPVLVERINVLGSALALSAGGGVAYTDEQVRDVMAAALVAGANVTITPDDAANTITIAATGGGGGGSGLPATIVNRTTAYTAAAGDFVQGDVTTAGFTVTLPTAPAVGALVAVKKVDTSSNTLTIAPSGGGTIDGDPTATTTTRWAGAIFEHIGSNVWRIAASMTTTGPAGPQGPAGPTGPQGPAGAAGTNGQGVPTGGTTGQVLAKTSNTDYATGWTTAGGTPDATTTSKGVVQLAGDLAGTAASPTVPGLAGKLTAASNLSDVASAATARTNLGLGTAATVNTGTASGDLPLLSTGGRLPIARIASGTPDGTKFVRDDGTLVTPAGGGSLTVQDEGSALTARGTINFVGAGVTATDDAANTRTLVTIPGGGGTASSARPVPPTTTLTGAYAETFPRYLPSASATAPTSTQPRLMAVTLTAGEVVTKLMFMNGNTTAISGATHQWAALCDASGVILAVSADDTSAAWAVTTPKTFTMTSAYTVPTSGVYYIAICLVATTMPTLMTITVTSPLGASLQPYQAASVPVITGGPPTVGTNIGTFTGGTQIIYAAVA